MQRKITIKRPEAEFSNKDETIQLNDPVQRQMANDSGIDLFGFALLFVRRWKLIVGSVCGVMMLTVFIALSMSNQYRSVATILPSGNVSQMDELKDLAGLGSMNLKNDNSSELYPTILGSGLVRGAVANQRYRFTNDGEPMILMLSEYFKTDNSDELHEALDGATAIAKNKKTGVITIGVETKYPELSQAIVTSYLAELEDFNLHKRRSMARENAIYLARQLEQTRNELAAGEDARERFQKANRNWNATSNPTILKTLSSLRRDIELKSLAYLFLGRELEAAKLEAQKDVPIVQILDRPSLPIEKSGPKRLLMVLFMGAVSFVFVIMFVVGQEAFTMRTAGPDRIAYEELRTEVRANFPRISRLGKREKAGELIDS